MKNVKDLIIVSVLSIMVVSCYVGVFVLNISIGVLVDVNFSNFG